MTGMISVILPVYNSELYLRQCLDSILNQTYHDIEIIVIDDGSSDKSGIICKDYAETDARIKFFQTENKGLSAARNRGLREAKGKFIGFVDSDDWIEPNMYEELLQCLEEKGTDISSCGIRIEYQTSRVDYKLDDKVCVGADAILESISNLENVVWNKLYKKDVWMNTLFPEDHTFEEISTLYKVVLRANALSCIPQSLYHYRMRNGSITHTPSMSNLKDYWEAYFERYAFLYASPEIKGNQVITNLLEKQVAFASVRTWRWIYIIPQKQRDYVFLHKVSNYMKTNYPIFGKKGWGGLRIGCFFSRYTNVLSFASMYFPVCFLNHIRDLTRKPFPSGIQGDNHNGKKIP